jgi:hypothetical protein
MNAPASTAPLSITASGLKLNPNPVRRDWWDETTPQRSLAEERRHRQERLAGAFRLFARSASPTCCWSTRTARS